MASIRTKLTVAYATALTATIVVFSVALYEERLRPFLAGDPRLAAEVARLLAVWMSFEDIIRVADLKTRSTRFQRIRSEVGAKEGEPVVVIDFLKPGVEEFASIMPALAWETRISP